MFKNRPGKKTNSMEEGEKGEKKKGGQGVRGTTWGGGGWVRMGV